MRQLAAALSLVASVALAQGGPSSGNNQTFNSVTLGANQCLNAGSESLCETGGNTLTATSTSGQFVTSNGTNSCTFTTSAVGLQTNCILFLGNNEVDYGPTSSSTRVQTFIGGGGVFIVQNLAADSATAVNMEINSGVTYGTPGDKILSIQNHGVEQLSVDRLGLEKLVGTAPRRQGSWQINLTADTTFTAIGLPSPSTVAGGGTCTPAADVASDTLYQMIKFPTDAASSGHACGVSGPYTTAIAPSYLPLFYAVVHTDAAAVTSTRTYIGMPKLSLDQVASLAAANAINGCYFRFDTGLADTDFMAESSDGTTASATDSTIAYSSNTTYVLLIDNSVSGECDYYVNGIKKVAKSSNITTTSQALGLEASITTLTTAVRNLSVAKVIMLEN